MKEILPLFCLIFWMSAQEGPDKEHLRQEMPHLVPRLQLPLQSVAASLGIRLRFVPLSWATSPSLTWMMLLALSQMQTIA
jgi:hypothetical protein